MCYWNGLNRYVDPVDVADKNGLSRHADPSVALLKGLQHEASFLLIMIVGQRRVTRV
jgi:hypothetical protein